MVYIMIPTLTFRFYCIIYDKQNLVVYINKTKRKTMKNYLLLVTFNMFGVSAAAKYNLTSFFFSSLYTQIKSPTYWSIVFLLRCTTLLSSLPSPHGEAAALQSIDRHIILFSWGIVEILQVFLISRWDAPNAASAGYTSHVVLIQCVLHQAWWVTREAALWAIFQVFWMFLVIQLNIS